MQRPPGDFGDIGADDDWAPAAPEGDDGRAEGPTSWDAMDYPEEWGPIDDCAPAAPGGDDGRAEEPLPEPAAGEAPAAPAGGTDTASEDPEHAALVAAGLRNQRDKRTVMRRRDMRVRYFVAPTG